MTTTGRFIDYNQISYLKEPLNIGDTIVMQGALYTITGITYETTSPDTLPIIKYDATNIQYELPLIENEDSYIYGIPHQRYRQSIQIEHLFRPPYWLDKHIENISSEDIKITEEDRKQFLELLE